MILRSPACVCVWLRITFVVIAHLLDQYLLFKIGFSDHVDNEIGIESPQFGSGKDWV